MPESAALAGCYINLDRCPDRAAYMQAQFVRLGLDWIRRLPAIDATRQRPSANSPLLAGEYACFLSHLRALEYGSADGCTLVLEDDTELSDQMPQLLDRLARGPLAQYDIVFLECQPHFSLAHLSTLWDTASRFLVTDPEQPTRRRAIGVELLDARPFFKWSTAAYVVSPQGRARLLALAREWLAQGPQLPFDRQIEQALVRQQLRGALIVPFLATTGLQWHGRSTIGNQVRQPHDLLMVLRRLLFAGSVAEAEAMADAMRRRQADPALAMFTLVLQEVAAFQRKEAESRRTTGRANLA